MLTYTYPFSSQETELNLADTTYKINSSPTGRFRYGLEVGWYHSFENPYFFHYLEAGVAYRSFSGETEWEVDKSWNNSSLRGSGNSDYQLDILSANIRFIRAPQLGKYTFLTFGPGLNFDYHLNDDRSPNPFSPEDYSQEYKLQAHFQLGFGIRLSHRLIFLPQIEVPLFEGYPEGKWIASQEFFGNQLYPLSFQLKFFFLRQDPINCNAPPAPEMPEGYN